MSILSRLQEKIESTSKRCQAMFSKHEVSIKRLAKLFGALSSTTWAILPVPRCKWCTLQRQEIHNLYFSSDCNSKVVLDLVNKEELDWWISNLNLSHDRSIYFSSSKASDTVWCIKGRPGDFSQKTSIGENALKQKRSYI